MGSFSGSAVIDRVGSSLGCTPWAATSLAFGEALNIIYFFGKFCSYLKLLRGKLMFPVFLPRFSA